MNRAPRRVSESVAEAIRRAAGSCRRCGLAPGPGSFLLVGGGDLRRCADRDACERRRGIAA